MKMMNKKKAQQAVIGIIFGLVLVMVFAVTLPLWFDFIEVGVNASVNQTNGALIEVILNVIPVFAALIVMVAVVILITGR